MKKIDIKNLAWQGVPFETSSCTSNAELIGSSTSIMVIEPNSLSDFYKSKNNIINWFVVGNLNICIMLLLC